MKTYESRQKQLLRNQEDVYAQLSDLRNMERYLNAIPENDKLKIENLVINQDTISFSVSPIGQVVLKIVDAEAPKVIKFGAENFPIPFNFWIQLVGVAPMDTRMKLTLKADIPMILKPMIGNKLELGIEQIADVIAHVMNAGV